MRHRSRKEATRIRSKACKYAAVVLSGREDSEALIPLAWSLTVFFEMYITDGAAATRKDFGPKKPRKLKDVSKP